MIKALCLGLTGKESFREGLKSKQSPREAEIQRLHFNQPKF